MFEFIAKERAEGREYAKVSKSGFFLTISKTNEKMIEHVA